VVTAMHHRLHEVPNVRFGMLVYPFSEARTVVARCVDLLTRMPEALTVQIAFVAGPDGRPLVLIVPTWCGAPAEGVICMAPFLELGTLIAGAAEEMPYGRSLTAFDAFIVYGRRTFMETSWLPGLDENSIDALIEAMGRAV